MLQYKNNIYEHVLNKSISSFTKFETSTYISALTNDVNYIEENYIFLIFTLITQITLFLSSIVITIIFELIAEPLAKLFSLSGGSTAILIYVCINATRIASLGYIFMVFSIAVQGILQGLRYAVIPFLIALSRLIIFVLPIAYSFTLSNNVVNIVWWTFPIVEIITAIISFFILRNAINKKVECLF